VPAGSQVRLPYFLLPFFFFFPPTSCSDQNLSKIKIENQNRENQNGRHGQSSMLTRLLST
jgi:hypothetical protein